MSVGDMSSRATTEDIVAAKRHARRIAAERRAAAHAEAGPSAAAVLAARGLLTRGSMSGAPRAMRNFSVIIQAWNRRRAGRTMVPTSNGPHMAGRTKFLGQIDGMR